MATVAGVLLGLVCLGIGALMIAKARFVALVSESIDAIGTTTSIEEIELQPWRPWLTRLVGVGFAGFGAWVLLVEAGLIAA